MTPSSRFAMLPLLALTAACGSERPPAIAETRRDTAVIDGAAPSCSACAIEVGSPIRLGSSTDRETPHRVPTMLRDSRGTTYLTFHGWGDKPILRYDSSGRFAGVIGQSGRGPGEYEMTFDAFVGPGDSLHVFTAHGSFQTYAPDGAFARSIAMIGLRPFGAAADGSLFATRQGYPGEFSHVYRLAADGSVRDSFRIFSAANGGTLTMTTGKGPPIQRPGRMQSRPALAPDMTVWTLLDGGYRLEHHAADGTPRRLFGVSLPNHEPPLMTAAQVDSMLSALDAQGSRLRPRRQASPDELRALKERRVKLRLTSKTFLMPGSDDLLWILRTIPAPGSDTVNTKGERLAPNEAPGEVTIPRDIEDRLYHTVVEVIDAKRGQLIARTELPFLGVPAAPGYVGRVTADDDGFYIASIYSLKLSR